MRYFLGPLFFAGCLTTPGFTGQSSEDTGTDAANTDMGDVVIQTRDTSNDPTPDSVDTDASADLGRDVADIDLPDLSNGPLFEAFQTEGYSFTTSGRNPIRFTETWVPERDTIFFSKRIGATNNDDNHWTVALTQADGTLNFFRTAAGSEFLGASQQVRWRADSTITYAEFNLTDTADQIMLNEQTFVLFQATNNSSVIASAFVALEADGTFRRRDVANNTYLSYQTVQSPEFTVLRSDSKIEANASSFSESCSCDRSKTLLLYSYTVDGATGDPNESVYTTCGINNRNEISCERAGSDGLTIELRFQLVMFENNSANVIHERLSFDPGQTREDTQQSADLWISGLQGVASLGSCGITAPSPGDRAKSCNFRIGLETDRTAKVERLQPAGSSTIWVQGITPN